MQITRITKVRNKGKDYIRIFGYDENNQPVRLLKQFDNYVWMLEENIQKVSQKHIVQDGFHIPYNHNMSFEKYKKVILKNNKFTISKDLHKLCYNDDISPQTKYILQNKLEFSRTRHIAFFDIQTYYNVDNPDDNSCQKADAPITSIVFYSNIFKKYFTLTWHPMKEVPQGEDFYTYQDGNNSVYICDNESVILKIFCQMINEFNIDIITGWYSHGYDVPYIMKRLQKKFGSYDMISPIGNAWLGNKRDADDYYKIRINGLDSIDLMQVVQSLNYNLQNNKLDTAAEEILGTQFMKIKETTWRDWQENFDGFMKYVVRDVEILHMIDDKLKCFEYLIQMQILSSITSLNDIMSVTRLIDAMLIKKFWGRIIFPNTTQKSRQNFMGGRTIDPRETGVHRNVAVFDYASLYPTTIMAYNISPQTFLFSKGSLGEKEFNTQLQYLKDNNIHYVDTFDSDELFGERYIFMSHDEHIGIIPQLTLELYKMRKYYKKIIKTATTDDERLVADKKQYAIKIILNSIYGAMGFRYFRLYVPECADAVTFFGRKALKFAEENIKCCGTVLYQDTDSLVSLGFVRFRYKSKNN